MHRPTEGAAVPDIAHCIGNHWPLLVVVMKELQALTRRRGNTSQTAFEPLPPLSQELICVPISLGYIGVFIDSEAIRFA